jgi:ADP-dependent NAD(P)H-hydrate dehydratase / NAD(P)H-hydrate epimerase
MSHAWSVKRPASHARIVGTRSSRRALTLHFDPMVAANSLPVYLTADVRRIETIAGVQADPPPLMERAGLAAAKLARDRLLAAGKSVLVLAGPGNNGGDGFVLARHLKSWWYRVAVVFTGERARLSGDAAAAHDAWLAAGGTISSQPPDGDVDLVVDALFGIGLEREIAGRYAELIEYIDRQPGTVLAIDIPSGLHADSGRVLGRAVRADHTVTFIALKPGLLTLDGPDHCGELHVFDLGLDVEALVPAAGYVISPQVLTQALKPRALNTHKGTFGSVGIVGGATGMTGAALLAGRAALKLGAGRVYVGFLGSDAPRLDALQPELMLRTASEVLAMDGLTSVVLGPGLSQSVAAFDAAEQALQVPVPLVVDADALNLLGMHAELQEICSARAAPTVLTPHPAEAARLLQIGTAQVQQDRVRAARDCATRYRAHVVLKGAGTVLAQPDQRFAINTSGNPGLASAGMGDALCGILAALLAQGAPVELATAAAVFLHGHAADRLWAQAGGPIGLTASEVIDASRAALNKAIYGAAQ